MHILLLGLCRVQAVNVRPSRQASGLVASCATSRRPAPMWRQSTSAHP